MNDNTLLLDGWIFHEVLAERGHETVVPGVFAELVYLLSEAQFDRITRRFDRLLGSLEHRGRVI